MRIESWLWGLDCLRFDTASVPGLVALRNSDIIEQRWAKVDGEKAGIDREQATVVLLLGRSHMCVMTTTA